MENTPVTSQNQPADARKSYSPGKCNKLETIDWLSGFFFKDQINRPELVEVRFKNTHKQICKNDSKLRLIAGDIIVVETSTGLDVGMVSLASKLVETQIRKKEITLSPDSIPKVMRHASLKDLQMMKDARDSEYEVLLQSRRFAKELKLEMKINDVEFQADKKKVTFYYTAEGRVDFRELIKVYARNFKSKIEMRQIGIRQEAGRVGGLGDCGREICCSDWLTDFTTVPTIAAKQQNLYLNPSKLSGQCSRLKCCLNYELDIYLEALEKFPGENIVLKTEKASFKTIKIDILRGIMWFSNENESDNNYYPVALENIRKILDMNAKKHFPPDLSPFIEKNTAIISDEYTDDSNIFPVQNKKK